MKIVVTGSSGRLGSSVVPHLLSAGHDVVPIDVRLSENSPNAETHVMDLSDAPALTNLFRDAGAICHLGNLPMINTTPTTPGFINNVGVTHAVFESAIAANVPVVVNASSIQVYGVIHSPGRETLPHSVPKYFPIDEDHPHLPLDAYPLSKSMGEKIAEAFCRQVRQLSVVSLRFTSIWLQRFPIPSPPSHKGSLGHSLNTAVFADDAARACRLACERGSVSPGHIGLNIVSPQVIRPWSDAILREFYGEVPEVRGGLQNTEPLFSRQRAEEVLGFRAGPIYAE